MHIFNQIMKKNTIFADEKKLFLYHNLTLIT